MAAIYLNLVKLRVNNAKLRKNDIRCLGQAVSEGKLPRLEYLDLSDNILTACLEELLSPTPSHQFLRTLMLNNAQLSSVDLDLNSLSEAAHKGRLANLTDLYLSCNVLTNCMKILLDDVTEKKFSLLQKLYIENTQLNSDDLVFLSDALKFGALPM